MGKVLTGLFVGVFVGAMAYELLRKTDIARSTAHRVSDAINSAKNTFVEGYRSAVQPSSSSA